jgi:hypothetical protein
MHLNARILASPGCNLLNELLVGQLGGFDASDTQRPVAHAQTVQLFTDCVDWMAARQPN